MVHTPTHRISYRLFASSINLTFILNLPNHNNNLINNILNYILISASACAAESVISS